MGKKKDRESRLDKITRIAKERGLFFQTAEIYGGKAGFFTYGHLGNKLKENWERLWRENILGLDDNFYEIQSNNILPKDVFKASGHLESFNDPLTECKECHFRFRADQLLEDEGLVNAEGLSLNELEEEIEERELKCPKCGGELGKPKWFNMMFQVPIGFGEEKGYLSPETAQAAYLAFKREYRATRKQMPLGLGIVDKAYRNEISPRQMFFRLREFSQAELQIFFNPDRIDEHPDWEEVKDKKLKVKLEGEDEAKEKTCQEMNKNTELPKFYLYHASKIQEFYLDVLKIPKERFRFRELSKEEKAFYNKYHFDIEVNLDTLGGFKEVAGLHYRTDHDLKGHQKESGENLKISKDGKKFIPHVLELSFGVDRNIWTLLDVFYSNEKFKFPPKLAPYKVAVFPLVKKKKEFREKAKEIYNDLKQEFHSFYDDSGSVGRRYARQDEIGTPYCVTVDGESLKNDDVTIRDRDSTDQIRVKVSDLRETIRKLVNGEVEFGEVGEKV